MHIYAYIYVSSCKIHEMCKCDIRLRVHARLSFFVGVLKISSNFVKKIPVSQKINYVNNKTILFNQNTHLFKESKFFVNV